MRFLIVGAGALGGYFGGRLLDAGQDVTFLLRPRRVAQLAQTGLTIISPRGDLSLPAPPYVTSDTITAPYDVVMVGCKAYDLAQTMTSFAPAVGPDTMVLPLLNGMLHLEQLQQRFGAQRVLGGLCMISAALDADGRVRHLNDMHGLSFGELDGSVSKRVEALQAACAGANFDARASSGILQEMWEKWIFIASAAGITCLLRSTIGDIVHAGAGDLASGLLDECAAIAAASGYPPRPAALERSRAMLTAAGSPLTASMFKDLEKGGATEADHILGDLLRHEQPQQGVSLLRVAYAHLKTYEARRARETTTEIKLEKEKA